MSAAAAVAAIAAVGIREDASAAAQVTPWLVLAVAGGWLAMLTGRWLLRRGSRVTHLVILPPAEVGEVIDDALPMFFTHKPQAAPWPDGDTVVTDGMRDAIDRMTREDGRG